MQLRILSTGTTREVQKTKEEMSMDKGRHQAGNTGRRRRFRILAALAAALAVVLTVPALQVSVRALDFNKACSVTVEKGDSAGYAEIDQAVIKFTVAMIAKGSPVENSDTYHLDYFDGSGSGGFDFTGLGIPLNLTREELLDGEEDTDANYERKYKEYSEKIAQKAAAIVLKDIGLDDGSGSDAASTTETTELGTKKDLYGPGMYLVIPHGVGTSYKIEDTAEDGSKIYSTVAYSPTKIYTFKPIVITLPDRAVNGEETHTTGVPGDWLYDAVVKIKASEQPRYGKLVITKNLSEIEQRTDLTSIDPMTCVFTAEGFIGTKNVYSHSVSIVMDAAGTKSVTMDRIPIGATVTVTEEYSGGSYEVDVTDHDRVQEIKILPVSETGDPQTLVFDNQYNHTDHGGGSLTNHFEYKDGWTNDGTKTGLPDGSPDMKPYDETKNGNQEPK